MENLYEILESTHGASTEELRSAYKRLARLHHPDKNVQTTPFTNEVNCRVANQFTGASEKFIKIDRAWKILSNPQLRAQFDARWHEHVLAQDLPIQDIVPFEDFYYNDKDNMYSYSCRCGSLYSLSEIDSQLHFDIVCCETCSLTIKVIYDVTNQHAG